MNCLDQILETVNRAYGDYSWPWKVGVQAWADGDAKTGLLEIVKRYEDLTKFEELSDDNYNLGEDLVVCIAGRTKFRIFSSVLGPWVAVFAYAQGEPYATRAITLQSSQLRSDDIHFLRHLELHGLVPLSKDILIHPLPFPEGVIVDQPSAVCHGLFSQMEADWEPLFSEDDGALWDDPEWRAERSWAWRFDENSFCD
jgi:hypothetical protein